MRRLFPATLLALAPFALHVLAREVDRGVGRLLHTTLDLPDFVPLALSLVDWSAAARAVPAFGACGLALWILAAALHRRRDVPGVPGQPSWPQALCSSATLFTPLLLRPALTLLALGALAWQPTYPYGFTLPVALTQDWGLAQDLAAAAALAAALLAHSGWLAAGAARPAPADAWRPTAAAVFLMALLAYGLLAPARSRLWDGHPGNEPKYLRMAAALAQGLSLDVGAVDAPIEELTFVSPGSAIARASHRVLAEARRLTGVALLAPGALATLPADDLGVAHLTVRGKDGGAYHVLAPGPALILAPALRLDRALNRWRASPGRVDVALLLWNALAAGLVAAVFLLARDACGRAGPAAAAAAVAGLVPPLLFYAHQFYPEVPAALLFALALRELLFRRRWTACRCVTLAALLAPLPWLHQKYLPLWLALTAWSILRVVGALVPLRGLLLLLLPQGLTLAGFALFNFAITGSARPDALFRALGREGVGLATAGQGALGLLLDARYGLVPYVPLALVALAGAFVPGSGAARVRRALPVALAYYLTVATAENWTGSISNLGRFVLPLVPLGAAFGALALRDLPRRPAAAALLLVLSAWTAALAVRLWHDPHAANDSGVLLARSAFADGHVYLPDLLLRRWSDAAPALPAQIAAWATLVVAVGLAVRRWAGHAQRTARAWNGPAGATRCLAATAVLLLALAWLLERYPGRWGAAPLGAGLPLGPRAVAFVGGAGRVEGTTLVTAGGRVDLLVRSPEPLAAVTLRLHAPARVAVGAAAPVPALAGATLRVPLGPPLRLRGRRGNEEHLASGSLRVVVARDPSLGPVALRLAHP